MTAAEKLTGTAITVSELNSNVKQAIQKWRSTEFNFDFLIGDVSDTSTANGNRYFDLVNEESSIQCLIFSRTRSSLPEFEEGDRIAVKGKLTYYEKRGNCTIYVNDVVLVGESKYHKQIQETRNTLSKEGLFNDDKKQPLPTYPHTIGIVTSQGSDAEEDAITSIHSLYPDVNIHVYDSNVQGMAAVEELCEGIMYMDSYEVIDVIVVTRGGGSEKDLLPFNTEGVARMIANTNTPIVTAVGHEKDTPIVDDVADDRAMTPTEIGDVVVLDKENEIDVLYEKQTRLTANYKTTTKNILSSKKKSLTTQYQSFVSNALSEYTSSLQNEYRTICKELITKMENDLQTAFNLYQQEKQHEEETTELQAQRERYRKIAIGLAILFVILIIVLFVTI